MTKVRSRLTTASELKIEACNGLTCSRNTRVTSHQLARNNRQHSKKEACRQRFLIAIKPQTGLDRLDNDHDQRHEEEFHQQCNHRAELTEWSSDLRHAPGQQEDVAEDGVE